MHIFRICIQQKRYRCLESNERICVSRHVDFIEKIFPFSNTNIKTTQKVYHPKLSISNIPEQFEVMRQPQKEITQADNSNSQYTMPRDDQHDDIITYSITAS